MLHMYIVPMRYMGDVKKPAELNPVKGAAKVVSWLNPISWMLMPITVPLKIFGKGMHLLRKKLTPQFYINFRWKIHEWGGGFVAEKLALLWPGTWVSKASRWIVPGSQVKHPPDGQEYPTKILSWTVCNFRNQIQPIQISKPAYYKNGMTNVNNIDFATEKTVAHTMTSMLLGDGMANRVNNGLKSIGNVKSWFQDLGDALSIKQHHLGPLEAVPEPRCAAGVSDVLDQGKPPMIKGFGEYQSKRATVDWEDVSDPVVLIDRNSAVAAVKNVLKDPKAAQKVMASVSKTAGLAARSLKGMIGNFLAPKHELQFNPSDLQLIASVDPLHKEMHLSLATGEDAGYLLWEDGKPLYSMDGAKEDADYLRRRDVFSHNVRMFEDVFD